jgi:hypothetical protein
MTLFFLVMSSPRKSMNSFSLLHEKAITSSTLAQFQKQWSKRKMIWPNLTELKSRQPSRAKSLWKIRVWRFLTNRLNSSSKLLEAKLWLKGHPHLSSRFNKCKNNYGRRARKLRFGRQLLNSQTKKLSKPSSRGIQLKINHREWVLNLTDQKSCRPLQRTGVLLSMSK